MTSSFPENEGPSRLTRCPRCGNPTCGTFICSICGMRQRRKLLVFCGVLLMLVLAVILM